MSNISLAAIPRAGLFVLSGRPGSGKTTFARLLRECLKPQPRWLPSVTTRPPRPDDVSGESEYTHVSQEEFLALKQSGGFLWTVVHGGNQYGTHQRDVDDALASRIPTLTLLTPEKAKVLKDRYPHAVRAFYLRVSSARLMRRLHERGDAMDPALARLRETIAWDTSAQGMRTEDTVPVYDRIVENDGEIVPAFAQVLGEVLLTGYTLPVEHVSPFTQQLLEF